MPLTLGETITELEAAILASHAAPFEMKPADLRVYFDFVDAVPTDIACWRGWYVEPALGWEPSGYSRVQRKADDAGHVTAADLLKELNAGLHSFYTGWKGGEYSFNKNSPLHVANPGDSNYTMIESVQFHGWRIIIHTLWVENGGL